MNTPTKINTPAEKKNIVIWHPQEGPQQALIDCPIYEVFYGGARGGGKTDGIIGKMGIKAMRYGTGFNCLFFRKELPMLDDAIARSLEIYTKLGAKWSDQKKTWKFPNGARLRFRPLESVRDAEKYQGQNISDVCIEEAGNYADPSPIFRLHAVLRSAKGIPTQMHLTGNPGGPGQHWIKKRYIDPDPNGMKVIEEELPNGEFKKRVFIPAKVEDNALLMERDPGYIGNLYMVGSEALVRAWLDGDWNVVEGAFFDCWSTKLIIQPFAIPDTWTKFKSFDWGSAKPFSVGWWAVASENVYTLNGELIPKGAIIRYREWYGAKRDEQGLTIPNVGMKLIAEEVATGIMNLEYETIDYNVADPAIFKRDGGPSIAEKMGDPYEDGSEGIWFTGADNTRVGRNGAMGGWDQVRTRMKGAWFNEHGERVKSEVDEMGNDIKPEGCVKRPMIYFFSTCTDTIRTLPVIQHDHSRPEDLDTDSEDHAADDVRYACMSRPWVKQDKSEIKKNTDPGKVTLNEILKQQRLKDPLRNKLKRI